MAPVSEWPLPTLPALLVGGGPLDHCLRRAATPSLPTIGSFSAHRAAINGDLSGSLGSCGAKSARQFSGTLTSFERADGAELRIELAPSDHELAGPGSGVGPVSASRCSSLTNGVGLAHVPLRTRDKVLVIYLVLPERQKKNATLRLRGRCPEFDPVAGAGKLGAGADGVRPTVANRRRRQGPFPSRAAPAGIRSPTLSCRAAIGHWCDATFCAGPRRPGAALFAPLDCVAP